MKNLSKKLIIVALIASSFISFGNPKEDANNTISVVNDTKLKVVYNDVKKGHTLRLRTEDGEKIYSEAITIDGQLVKVLDLSALENGTYKIELEKDFSILVNTIKIENNTIIFSEDNDSVIFKPVVRNDNNLLLISKIAFDSKPLQVNIYYKDEMIYSETITNDGIIKKAYRLQKETKGAYRVVLYNNNRSYIHDFSF